MVPAASPVSTKIPVPMITPMPNTVSWIGPSDLRSERPGSSESLSESSMLLVRSTCMGR